MMNSDHSEVEDEDLKLSIDSTNQSTTKRPHIESEDENEQNIPAKKRRCSASKELETSEKNNIEITSDKNGINENDIKKEKDAVSFEIKPDLAENSSLNTNVKIKNKEDQEDKITKVKSEEQRETTSEDDSFKLTMGESPIKVKEEITSKDNTFKGPDNAKAASTFNTVKTEEDNIVVGDTDNCKENSKENETKEKYTAKNRSTDTEVVDGLELSVECASDKEGSSSDSADEEEKKPRPKTVIVKAEPNESELECGSSDDEKSDAQETNDAVEIKSKDRRKRRGTRTSFSKLKASGSEDSQNNNSDEDYNPRTKKKLKRSPATKRSTKRSTESKRGRGVGIRKNAHKKNTEDASDDENSDIISTDKTEKTVKNETEEEMSEKESSVSKSDGKSNSDHEEKPTKARRARRTNAKPEDNKQIQMLKKYLKVAGVRIKSYQEIWADCHNNTERINRLKELLEKKGITGRPTLEKCKRAKKKNEKIKEASELDSSNILSEGRVTRARRSMEGNKKPVIVETPPRHREARSTFKRLRSVVDSDSD
ncbi:lisH domain-containing protein C1711.05-like isoform X2 [Odontomachus brunneus]|uniref:lisH domain-containing protein C1711.05-like isoform X2 n=1 Tax=Odontomachus brunneus TaxID=486640 RepID=UPI0013F29F56|nr:lisH domain-containing protein C1711.05-like isoform X2 [Odontomachus brunneus]